ncbi:MAG: hypothetical protein U5L02_07950 [Rheinheimera sp.]|nr:hypothetical protein [Rheinheimera sp.]
MTGRRGRYRQPDQALSDKQAASVMVNELPSARLIGDPVSSRSGQRQRRADEVTVQVRTANRLEFRGPKAVALCRVTLSRRRLPVGVP